MEKLDETIEAVCDWVQKACKGEVSSLDKGALPEMVKALAELVSARTPKNVDGIKEEVASQIKALVLKESKMPYSYDF